MPPAPVDSSPKEATTPSPGSIPNPQWPYQTGKLAPWSRRGSQRVAAISIACRMSKAMPLLDHPIALMVCASALMSGTASLDAQEEWLYSRRNDPLRARCVTSSSFEGPYLTHPGPAHRLRAWLRCCTYWIWAAVVQPLPPLLRITCRLPPPVFWSVRRLAPAREDCLHVLAPV
jgi:hypothetical protein